MKAVAWVLRSETPQGFVAVGFMAPEMTQYLHNAELFASRKEALNFKRNYSCVGCMPAAVVLR